ncbi:hypothetical protein HERIO_1272 [Hepatospora eriocheir]|uniref:Uncharacterized protein n=1 Tax=Hepatospora eriocheir TaxID=1081669 RepID=A0A1X0QAK7_9MICR|nr:hypothetical protein HERIO_1272 [Hepatospora eriocheir]
MGFLEDTEASINYLEKIDNNLSLIKNELKEIKTKIKKLRKDMSIIKDNSQHWINFFQYNENDESLFSLANTKSEVIIDDPFADTLPDVFKSTVQIENLETFVDDSSIPYSDLMNHLPETLKSEPVFIELKDFIKSQQVVSFEQLIKRFSTTSSGKLKIFINYLQSKKYVSIEGDKLYLNK